MRIASIDMGSNTTLMLICDVVNYEIKQVIGDFSEMTRLSQDLQVDRMLKPEALARMEDCLRKYQQIIQNSKVDKIVAVATSAARDAKNQQEFHKITERYGIPVRIISGEKEAEVTFAGSTYDQPNKEGLVVIDVGGGSTEVVGQVRGQTRGHSLNLGSVRLTEQFISTHPIPSKELDAMLSFIATEIERQKELLPPPEQVQAAVAVAGTPTTLAMVLQKITFDEERVHGFAVDRATIHDWMARLSSMTVRERSDLIGMHPKRADVIVAGLGILAGVLGYLRIEKVKVSTKGVRYGLALLHDKI